VFLYFPYVNVVQFKDLKVMKDFLPYLQSLDI